ncbi:MAG: SDR family oxidoreductase [Deltaproteobacteria bacterium]|nr:SDR family oxidoreductase [Deltaproteobacteria bacterium]MBW2414200.1 SDR family oxidoreductase [Deltaproteobacteria bacterium]
MELGLSKKGVVVTGGSRGIGRAIALAFADEGADVAICARGEDALRKTEEELRSRGGKVHAQVCDVSDAAALDGFLDQSKQALGRIDVLVNNTSAFGMGDDDDSWRAGFEVDVLAGVRATRRALPEIEAAGGGCVIFISSTAALEAPAGPSYSAMKAALISYSKNLAVQLAPRNIRVNTVAPGSIDFPGGVWDAIKQANPAMYESIRKTIPAGRLGTPEEVANAVVFLASERASWITGVTLSVDGSQHKGNL